MAEGRTEKEAAEGSLGSPEKRTKDENEDENYRDMALNTYLLHLTLFHPGKPPPSPIEDDEDEEDWNMTLNRYGDLSPGWPSIRSASRRGA
jgi:hypothetical protein